MSYYYRDGLKTAIIILALLLVLAAGAGVYFYLTNASYKDEMALIESVDYEKLTVSVDNTSQKTLSGYSVHETSGESVSDNVYITPLGFPIESYSEKWQGVKLKEIYEELIKNKHGDEINYISKIAVYGGRSEIGTTDSVIAGTHSTTQEHYQVFLDLPVVMPPSLKFGLISKQSVIELYNMDEYDTIEKAARTIAHEYGHHFTIYYFLLDDEAAVASAYYTLRDFAEFDNPIFFANREDYYENHMWSIYEIAAEDYVQIMGSPNTIQTREYLDIYDVLMAGDTNYHAYADGSTSNVFPQENMNITLANEVPELRDYFFSFISEENETSDIQDVDYNMTLTKRYSHGNVYYEITWDNVFDSKDALYTLVCYNNDKEILRPVRTTYGNEEQIARVGTVAKIQGNIITTYTYGLTDEDRYFRLIVFLPDGRITASEYYYADF